MAYSSTLLSEKERQILTSAESAFELPRPKNQGGKALLIDEPEQLQIAETLCSKGLLRRTSKGEGTLETFEVTEEGQRVVIEMTGMK